MNVAPVRLAALREWSAGLRSSLPELLLAGIAAVLIVAEVWVFDPGGWTLGRTVAGLTAAGSLVFLRHEPFAAFLGNGLSLYALVAIGYSSEFYQWTNLIALFAVASRVGLGRAGIALALGYIGIVGYFLRFPEEGSVAVAGTIVAVYTAGWFAGRAQFARTREATLVQDNQVARAELAAQLARGDLEAERGRIARELHDVVGHAVNVMVIHAGAGQGLAEDETKSREIFATIATTGRAALSDLDRMLDVLSHTDQTEDADRRPMPGLDQLEDICGAVRSTGLDVDLSVTGTTTAVSPSVGLAGFRIVQEALTNVIKHSGATAVRVEVESRPDDDVAITVRDNGSGGQPVPGRGLGGIATRAQMHGGSATFGPAPDGGFEVSVRLPAGSPS